MQLYQMTQCYHTNIKRLTVLHQQASSAPAHTPQHLLHNRQPLRTKIPLNLPSSHISSGEFWLCIYGCAHTREQSWGGAMFPFLHHLFPSLLCLLCLASSSPPITCILCSVCLIHSSPSYLPVWSKCWLTAVQRACAASGGCERVLADGWWTNKWKKRGQQLWVPSAANRV